MVSVVKTHKCQFQNHVFYNDCVLHPEADKTSTDGSLVIKIITQALISRKITRQKFLKNHNRPKKGSGQNHFRPKKWSGYGRTGRTADDGLANGSFSIKFCMQAFRYKEMKISLPNYGHMTICGKTLQKSSSPEPKVL